MQVEPIINARFKQFRIKNELENVIDGIAFEKFVNYTIFTLHQPDAFNVDSELLEFVSVGGSSDMGIDGIAIKVNDILVKSKEDIDDIVNVNNKNSKKRINVEFIFIQSKYRPNYDKGELNNFVDGVRDFLSDTHNFPMNEEVKSHLKLKQHLLSDDLSIMWETNPKVTLYYVTMGRWQEPEDLLGIKKQFIKDVETLNIYDTANLTFVDSGILKEYYDSIQNTFNVTIDTRHIMPLTDVNGVENSCLSIVYGSELLKLISYEGIIRKSLFYDNVRDFQGSNPVNSEIHNTIKNSPEKFIILNNGITIVCDEFKQNNTKISIFNPQIVNGCQTSHILFEADKLGLDIANVPVSIRFISTTDEEIVNEIVRGTNRQNIVLEEAFETTKKFHKDLEEFFTAYSQDYDTIYYERRSRQFQNNPTIKQTEKINLRVLTQYFVGIYLNKPHSSHRHESILLKDFGDKIFQDFHSKLPYFVTSYTFIKFEKFLRENKVDKIIRTYKPHILMMFRQSIGGYVPSFNKEIMVDKHSKLILDVLSNETKTNNKFIEIIELFKKSMNKWESELGNSKRATKDVEKFTLFLIDEVNNNFKIAEIIDKSKNNNIYTGIVLNSIIDRFGKYYGFISKEPENIFFHSKDNEHIDFNSIRGKRVIFEILPDKKGKNEQAKIKSII